MPTTHNMIAFALVALGMVLTPGPNMIYLISRSINQGAAAGFMSLAGIALGFVFYLICAALGITTLILLVPYAYDTLRIAGALYLMYLAWQALKPNGRSAFQVTELDHDGPKKLFFMGFLTSALNPKVAIIYVSLLPQFMSPGSGSILSQSLVLGSTQILVSLSVNALIILMAGRIAYFLNSKPSWMLAQRYLMGTVLFGLATRILFDNKR
ncbi:MAG: LysE family translocator [Neisseriaceae bacterium]|nr:LysE family translocator [Neisseriaceae bacterium]